MEEKMRFFSWWRTASLLLLAVLLMPASLKSQTQTPVPVPVTLSGEKIVVEGRVYYMHQVMKGQTLYSIARAYSVSVDMVARENGLVDNAIKDGQVLRIPAAAVDQGQAAMKNHPAGTQTGTAGQTGQAQQAAQSGQPGQGKPAVAGAGAQVPQKQSSQDDRFIYHMVRRGETLGTIANDYGITVRDLKRANRGLLFPHEGDYLLIPKNKASYRSQDQRAGREQVPAGIPADTAIADTMAVIDEQETFTMPGEKNRIDRLDGTVRVAVLFPFFVRENTARAYADTTERVRTGSQIYDGSLPFLEAYEGVLIAADSLRSLGLTVEMKVYDTGADSAEIKRLLRTGELDDVDLIIGPVFSYNLQQIAGWAAERDIPVVSPVPLRDSHIHENKPSLYRVFPSQEVVQDLIADEVASRQGSRVIFLYSDTAMYDPATASLWQKVKQATGDSAISGGGRVVPYFYTGVTEKRNVYSTVASFESQLDHARKNIIVLATTSTPVVSSAFSALHSLTKRYDIMVIGYPEIRGLETVDLKYYYDLELHIPSESYVDYEAPGVKSFSAMYMKKFRTEPMAESFAWRGFDIAWYFIGGIASGGKSFLKDPGTFNPELLCLEPDFSRSSRNNGYENRGMFILHYRKDMTIEVLRPRHQPLKGGNDQGEEVSSPFSGSSERNRAGWAGRQD
ncbi:MAG TPA: LysM peptidoglycan-binding domain-containing protein [Bacteroidales bacterium]|jgi:LysM repeat protein|nr:LysM peptidoglycan-binding domain-containing protein [Bacteroidales bacterium]HNX83568.1 LysM peptidoglycan-binding domain-containing protein [Bacteroidales bacterium]HPS96769.1 LysM peptidoglycan-binding domain-containing protein [Bacteroidales bacterium]